jgi:hypothetical protein
MEEENDKPSRHTHRQRVLRKCRRAAKEDRAEDLLKNFMELCLLEIEGNERVTEKITPRIIIDILNAQIALKKAQKEGIDTGVDDVMKAFNDRLKVVKGGK